MSMFRVCNCNFDNSFKEPFQENSSFIINHVRNTLSSSSTNKKPNRAVCNSLNIVSKFSISFRTTYKAHLEL
jgi:hypothetical protein